MPDPLASCLCVTRLDRLALFARAAADFGRQTYPRAELVVVHHDGPGGTAALAQAAPFARVVEVPRAPLGELRNRAVRAATGEVLVQWDDDDLHHPDRLAVQVRALAAGDCCFLGEQVAWFEREGFAGVWAHRPIWGTLACRAAVGPVYQPLARGEDRELFLRQLRGTRVGHVRGRAGLYGYRFHGANTWGFAHHLGLLLRCGRAAAELAAWREKLAADCVELGLPRGTPILGRDGLAFRL